MRNAVAVGGAVFLAILVCLPATAAATSANLVATSGIPLKLFGDSSLKSRQSTLVIDGEGAVPTVRLDASRLDVQHIRVTTESAPLVGSIEPVGERRVIGETVPPGALHAILTGAEADLVVIARGYDATVTSHQPVDLGATPNDLWRQSQAQLGVLLAPDTPGPRFEPLVAIPTKVAPSLPGLAELAAGTYQSQARDATATLARVSELVLFQGTLTLGTDRLLATRSVSQAPGSVYVPGAEAGSWIGPGTHRVEVRDYFVLRPGDGVLAAVAPKLTLYASDVFVQLHGYLGLPWAQGTVATPNETVKLSGEQVVLGGDLRLRPVGFDLQGAPSLTLLGDGDVQFLQVGVQAPRLSDEEVAVVATGAAAGLGIVAALVYFWPALKYAASAVLFPLYARVPKERTLDHKGRELLYELVKNEPGISTNQLAKEVPFGWSTLTYHLRVLERNEAIVSVRDGRYKRFFDRQSGRFSNGRKFILAVLKNDATLDIAKFIRTKPGSSQKEVAGTFQLSPSSVHWHVERLSEVGLVQKLREAHNVKYYPGEGWDHVSVEDLKTLEPGANATAAAPGPSDAAPSPAPSI